MMKELLLMRPLIAWLAIAAVSADKDGSYYPEGMENPNVNKKMYWAEAGNVLDDLSQFDALYVTHHNCV